MLTGAGISAESGVPTFRDADGLWEGHRVEDVATPEAFDVAARAWCTASTTPAARRSARVAPNPAHLALAGSRSGLGDDLLVVTQNIDDLHERAGLDPGAAHARRAALGAVPRLRRARTPWTGDLGDCPPCPRLRRRPSCGRTSCGSARCPTRWTGSSSALDERRPVRLDRHLGRGLPGRRRSSSSPPAPAPAPSSSTSRRATVTATVRRGPARARPASWCRAGWTSCSADGSC